MLPKSFSKSKYEKEKRIEKRKYLEKPMLTEKYFIIGAPKLFRLGQVWTA